MCLKSGGATPHILGIFLLEQNPNPGTVKPSPRLRIKTHPLAETEGPHRGLHAGFALCLGSWLENPLFRTSVYLKLHGRCLFCLRRWRISPFFSSKDSSSSNACVYLPHHGFLAEAQRQGVGNEASFPPQLEGNHISFSQVPEECPNQHICTWRHQDSFVFLQQYMAAICLKEIQSHVQFIPTVTTFSCLGSMPELTRTVKSRRGREMNHQILHSFFRKKRNDVRGKACWKSVCWVFPWARS